MKKFLLSFLLICCTLNAGIPVQGDYHGPTEQLIKRDSWKKIEKELKSIKIPLALVPYFNEIAAGETWGHIGYHAANQGFRVYQDVIRITIEEILGIPVRDTFHFLRVPGDQDLNLDSINDFYAYWGKFDNKNSTRAKQLLSMNFGIYSNYDLKGSCSLYLFVKNKSKRNIDYAHQLAPFYKNLGMNTNELNRLFDIGRKWLDEDSGILLRLYENSHLTDKKHEAYNFADYQCYTAEKGGYAYGSSLISTQYGKMMTDSYVSHKVNIAPQLRLLVNNHYTLNPYSHLSIERFDLYDSETIASYETELRKAIRKLKFDAAKAEKFRDRLLKSWL